MCTTCFCIEFKMGYWDSGVCAAYVVAASPWRAHEAWRRYMTRIEMDTMPFALKAIYEVGDIPTDCPFYIDADGTYHANSAGRAAAISAIATAADAAATDASDTSLAAAIDRYRHLIA